MAGGDSFGCCGGLVEVFCGLAQVFLAPRGRPSAGILARRPGDPFLSSSQAGWAVSPRDVEVRCDMERSSGAARMLRFDYREENLPPAARNSPAAAGDLCSSSSMVGLTSWDMEIMAETEYSLPVARQLRSAGQDEGLLSPMVRNSPAEAPPQPKGMAGGVEDDDDDDDCVILDSDPFSAVAVNDEKDGGSDEELQIVAEKGKVACRDFPHSRHLCSNMPFGATSHEKHCAMCYCFVCDAPAPCSHWGKGLSVGDHCHATDKETKWKMLREAFRCRNLPASHPETETAVHPAMVSLGRLFLSNQISLQDVVTQNRNTHTSVRASLSVAPIVNAPREGSGTGSAHTAQVTRLGEPTVSAPRAHPVAGAGRGTSSTHTAQISAPRAFSATGVGRSGTSSAHSAQVTRLVEPTVNAPRPHPEVGAGRGTSSTHTAQITHPVEPTVGAARAYSAARTGRGTSNAQSAQITRTVEQTVSAPRVYPAAGASSNAHSAQITYPATAGGYLPEPDAPEGATVYVGNLPYHIDNERLKLSFQGAGVVLFSKVIYDRETGQSRGFGFVTMSTVQEAEKAVRIYHGSGMYGRPLTVKIAAPRGGARVDAPRRQSGSPLRIFVCNLPSQVDNSRLEELFSKHGKVVDARVVYERREGASCSRGFGFVTMATDEESYKAIRALNKQILEGNALGVKVARERADPVCLPLSNRIPPQNAVSPNQHAHTSVGASLNVAPTVSAPRAYRITGARSSTSNASTAQVTHRLDPTVNAPRPGEYGMLPPPSS
ncbi:uncharacterized protein LOC125552922 [Triticum urartu]|uniref:RRM domain-containing protein n=2 Tax=Triticum urartu TaxID=4572 RepID=A0A8R7UA46_TRIUA|nr:uncharacterized protein LOC125552922 [Triticum urartu]